MNRRKLFNRTVNAKRIAGKAIIRRVFDDSLRQFEPEIKAQTFNFSRETLKEKASNENDLQVPELR